MSACVLIKIIFFLNKTREVAKMCIKSVVVDGCYYKKAKKKKRKEDFGTREWLVKNRSISAGNECTRSTVIEREYNSSCVSDID